MYQYSTCTQRKLHKVYELWSTSGRFGSHSSLPNWNQPHDRTSKPTWGGKAHSLFLSPSPLFTLSFSRRRLQTPHDCKLKTLIAMKMKMTKKKKKKKRLQRVYGRRSALLSYQWLKSISLTLGKLLILTSPLLTSPFSPLPPLLS
jgi:hypothetical protein